MNNSFYENLINNSPIAYAYYKMIFDEEGKPADYEFIDINPVFCNLFTFPKEKIIGKKASDFFQKDSLKFQEWIKIMAKSAVEGISQEFEESSPDGLKTYKIFTFSTKKNYFATYAIDVSKEDDQFQRIIESLPFSVSIITLDGTILYANEKGFELFELDPKIIGTNAAFLLWMEPERRKLWVQEIMEKGVVKDFDMHLKTLGGREFWARGSGVIIDYKGQKCVLSSQHDITEKRAMEEALRLSEEKYRFITEFASDVIWVLNITKNMFTYISPSIFNLRGLTVEEAMQEKLEDSMTPDSLSGVEAALRYNLPKYLANPHVFETFIYEIQQPNKDSALIWVEVSTKIRLNDAGEIEVLGISRDITERKKAQEEILYLSYHDQLTGLYNRRYYEEQSVKLNKAENLPLGIIMADVNGLKLTNDAFGHNKGDELLSTFAGILKKNAGKKDLVARIGGDEFIIISSESGCEDTEKIIENINKDIDKIKERNIFLSVSLGYTVKKKAEEPMSRAFIRAEDAMYKNKLNESSRMKDEIIERIMIILAERHPETIEYNQRISDAAVKIAQALDLSKRELDYIKNLARLHNIGKIVDNGKTETGKYPETGYQILKSATSYAHLADFVLSHHEHFDGTGYPRGLKGDEIPLLSRILSTAETWVDLEQQGKGIEELKEKAGKELDDRIVEIFIEKVLG